MDKDLVLNATAARQLIQALPAMVDRIVGFDDRFSTQWDLLLGLLSYSAPNYNFDITTASRVFNKLVQQAVVEQRIDLVKTLLELARPCDVNGMKWEIVKWAPKTSFALDLYVLIDSQDFNWNSDKSTLGTITVNHLQTHSPARDFLLSKYDHTTRVEAINSVMSHAIATSDVELAQRMLKLPNATGMSWSHVAAFAFLETTSLNERVRDIAWSDARLPVAELVFSWAESGVILSHTSSIDVMLLNWFALNDKLDWVKRMIGINKDCITANPRSAYIYAVKSGNVEIVKYVEAHGAKPDPGAYGANELVKGAMCSGSLELVQALLDEGYKIPETYYLGPYGPCCDCNSAELFDFVYQRKGKSNDYGRSVLPEVLAYAIEHGAHKVVQRMLDMKLVDISVFETNKLPETIINAIGQLDEDRLPDFFHTLDLLAKLGFKVDLKINDEQNNKTKFGLIKRLISYSRLRALIMILERDMLGELYYYFQRVLAFAVEKQSPELVAALFKNNSSRRRWATMRTKLPADDMAWVVQHIPDDKVQQHLVRHLVADELEKTGTEAGEAPA